MITQPLKERHVFLNLIILIFLIILFPAISLADANKIFKENNKAVVVVVTFDKEGNPIGQGSGFIVRSDGAIVTNYHVISNASDIKVKAGDKILDVEGLIYADKENDVVILKAKGREFQIVKLGDIGKTDIGEKVFVISSPEGLENTISDGILSGIREITPERKVLQITAPISSGSSGGAVFNKDGEVIGIATFLIEKAQNLNFAIPVNIVKDKITNKKIIGLKDSVIEDYKKTAEYWLYVGFNYLDLDMYKKAKEAYEQAIKLRPDFAGSHYILGFTYAKLRMYKEAIAAYEQAIKLNPDFAAAYDGLGRAYSHLGMAKEAMESFKQAISIEPDNATALYDLGVSYIVYLSKHRDAIELLKRAIRIEPNQFLYHYSLGHAYKNIGMYKEAVESFIQALRIEPDNAMGHLGLGSNYCLLGRFSDCKEECKQAIKIKPDYADAHDCLGMAYLALGDKGSALEEYKILKDIDPEMAIELFNLIYE